MQISKSIPAIITNEEINLIGEININGEFEYFQVDNEVNLENM